MFGVSAVIFDSPDWWIGGIPLTSHEGCCSTSWTGQSPQQKHLVPDVSSAEVENPHTKVVYDCTLYIKIYTAAAAKLLGSCPTLCDPMDGSAADSPVPGILQARTLEWVAISFSAWKWKVKVKSLSRVRLLATPWTAAYQAPPSMGFSRQEYWSGVPLPSP